MPLALARRIAAALLCIAPLTASPAKAEIEKFMRQCDGKLCASFRASITIPDGWTEDKEASDYFRAQMLLPKGIDFDKAPAKIYVVVRYDRNKRPLSDFLPDTIKDWKGRAKDAKISRLDDLARAGKPPFVRHTFEAPRLKEQSYELQAVTTDDDKDGNQFVVTITLSADSKAALEAAQPAYSEILTKY